MKRTWNISDKYTEIFNNLNQLTSPLGNWINYRALIEGKPPYVPYVGLFLTDITFLCGAESTLEDGRVIWQKK